MLIVVVVILIIAVLGLIGYNLNIHKKIQTYKNINQKINNLSVVQDFMSTIGETSTVDDKIKRINDILIEKYEIKYSTIVVFNGAEYEIKASNVDEKHWDSLKSLQDVDMFKDSIAQATPKYVTVNNEQERLPYQKMEFGRAKSAIFFPLYIDNVYIGYWIIESGTPHDFDNVDTTVLEVIKDNIVSGESGKFSLEKLLPGKYLLVETKAGTGYSLPADPWRIEISSTGEDVKVYKTNTTVIQPTTTGSMKAYQIENARIYSLPSSGGPGIYGFTISGVAFITAALLLFINNKRKEDNIAG